MADLVEIHASRRDTFGKKLGKLRREGAVPANLYGRSQDSFAIKLNDREIEHLLATHSRSQPVTVLVEGKQEHALIAAVQRHPTRQNVLHVDFHRIALDQAMHVEVPLVFVGEAPAIRLHDAVILHNLTSVMVEGLPEAIPSEIEVDVAGLEAADAAIYVSDLSIPAGLKVIAAADELVAKAVHSTVESESGEPGAEAAESAAAS